MKQITGLDSARARRCPRQVTCMLENALQSGTNRHDLSPTEHLPKRGDRCGHGCDLGGFDGAFSEYAEPSSGLTISKQRLVAEPEKWTAQDADKRCGILRVGQGAQQECKLPDLLGIAECAGTVHFHWKL